MSLQDRTGSELDMSEAKVVKKLKKGETLQRARREQKMKKRYGNQKMDLE